MAKPGAGQPTIRVPASASAAAICPLCGSIQKIRRSFTQRAWCVGSRPMVAKPGRVGAAHRAATITKTFGSIRTVRTSFFSAPTRARLSPSMAERPGVRGIINRPRNCIMSARTTRFRTGYTVVSRKAVLSGSQVVATMGKSPSVTGSRSRRRNTVTWSPIRSIRTSSSAAN